MKLEHFIIAIMAVIIAILLWLLWGRPQLKPVEHHDTIVEAAVSLLPGETKKAIGKTTIERLDHNGDVKKMVNSSKSSNSSTSAEYLHTYHMPMDYPPYLSGYIDVIDHVSDGGATGQFTQVNNWQYNPPYQPRWGIGPAVDMTGGFGGNLLHYDYIWGLQVYEGAAGTKNIGMFMTGVNFQGEET